MELTILGSGTSQGIPVIACGCEVCSSTDTHDKRLRSSALLEINGQNIVIDAGPDFRYQMLREKVLNLRAILLTHGHKDHIGGLDDVRAFNWVNKRPMDIYCEHYGYQSVYNDYGYAFAQERYPGVPEMNLHLVDKEPFKIDDIVVTPIPVMHHKLPILGYRINNFAYITDTNYIPEASMKLLEGVEVLVLNALRQEKHISHFTLSEALEVIEKLNVRRAFLTHIGHQMGLSRETSKELPANVSFAFDGQKIEI
ncbi:MAG: MBL fold metallo-hydrolase [Marinifilaceae bacterium]